MQALMLVEY